jgi:nickel-dependent lactate racemase
MSSVSLPQLAWHGAKELTLSLPDQWPVRFYHFAGYDRSALQPAEIREATHRTIDSPPISELARGKKEVVIIFDDLTRVTRTYEMVPFILEELAAAGIPDRSIQFVCALGAHMAWDRTWFEKKLGRSVLARFPVYNHNPFNKCTYVGTTSFGTRVCISDEVARCDLKIALGSVVPHPNTGFGGGGKIILPGVSAMETIEHFHCQEDEFRRRNPVRPVTGMGVFDENPLRQNVDEACALAGLDIKVDGLINMWGETVAVFAGAPRPTYQAAVRAAKTHYLTPSAGGEQVVIANTFAKANESIMIGLHTAFQAVDPRGGDVVLVSNAPDGQVTHYLLGTFGKGTRGNIALEAKVPERVGHVIIYSEYPDLAGRAYIEKSDKVLFLDDWDEVLQTLRRFHPEGAEVAVLPNAEIQYFAES